MVNNTGGPAFPTPRYERGDMYSLGMTLRDYFAAKAMQGLLSSGSGNILAAPTAFARDAYAVADALLAAREQK